MARNDTLRGYLATYSHDDAEYHEIVEELQLTAGLESLVSLINTAKAVNSVLGVTTCLPQDLDDEAKWPAEIVEGAVGIWNEQQEQIAERVRAVTVDADTG